MTLIKLNRTYITKYKSLIKSGRVAVLTKAADVLIYLLTYLEPLEHLYAH